MLTFLRREERIEIFSAALEKFTAAGYEYIGLDHFALPEDSLAKAQRDGRLNRNFMGYSNHRGARILGVGVSAISTLPFAYAQNSKDINDYQLRVDSGEFPTVRGLLKNEDDCIRAAVIEALLCQGRIDIRAVEEAWKIDFRTYFSESLEPFTRFHRRWNCRIDRAVD